eukprot:TRINITY_DN6474_c0_g1_i22.p3 TRINITY_DN6474_c0_g1~~TRINITY_DN6474_c0_g1_i22.p3  ORF type:complete len:123 (-),score=11.80 TRINITY_DN6474_c0_g1_i22:109-477(-)
MRRRGRQGACRTSLLVRGSRWEPSFSGWWDPVPRLRAPSAWTLGRLLNGSETIQRDMDLRDFLFGEGSRRLVESHSRASASAASSARPPLPPPTAPEASEASVGPDAADRDEERPRQRRRED